MERIAEGVEQGRAGDLERARAILGQVWDELGPDGDPLHVVSLAHYMADVQQDPVDELEWDRRALAAAERLTDERAEQYHASLAVQGFYPSLYLNLADDHAKLHDFDAARANLAKAEAAGASLPDGDYGDGIRAAMTRLRTRLETDREQ